MIRTTARVISAEQGTVMVEAGNESGCGGCSSRSACGVSGLGKYFSGTRKAIAVHCDGDVRAGEELQLSMSEGDMLRAGLLAYLLPSVLGLVGAAAAAGLGDAFAVAGAVTGVGLGLLLGRVSGWQPQLQAQRSKLISSQGETT